MAIELFAYLLVPLNVQNNKKQMLSRKTIKLKSNPEICNPKRTIQVAYISCFNGFVCYVG